MDTPQPSSPIRPASAKNRTPSSLTARHRRVIELIAQGRNNHDIAHEMGLSTKTIDTHRQTAMRVLGLAGRRLRGDVVLTHYAIKMGWVATKDPQEF